MTTVILWRHGNTDWNNARRYQGQTDIPLNERGVAQAAAAATRLALYKPGLIISSDLSRAATTAAELGRVTGLAVERDARLRERSFGPWEGLTRDEVTERYPEAMKRWKVGETLPEDGLEPLADLGKRVTEAIRQAADRVPGGVAVVVTHGASVKWGISTLLGWPDEIARTVRPLDNCHWSELRLEDGKFWVLASHNVGPHAGV
ncbi:histidine phosphatase family protein [Catelliglobosispora koreensis]|uniref:histidine phosphatase family protein n=1 Tax=Catelliglobosispora koreensis TaxID=129052 RepID=UPI00036431D2|nr:histidine phosphatase family protein [Catelliglobosispora koreensis]